MADTRIREDFRGRRVGGGLLVFIALPLTLFTTRFVLPDAQGLSDALIFLAGPALLALGLWAAFPRRRPAVRMTIGDDAVTIHTPNRVIALDEIKTITQRRPALAKHDELDFETTKDSVSFAVMQLTHEAPDIIHLINVRLEKRGKYLRQKRSEVLGSLTGTWEVQVGVPFEENPKSDRIQDVRE